MITKYATTMAAYNRWMNGRLYGACAELPDEQRKRDLGAFFKSIHGTLNHILLADRIWMGRFAGTPLPVKLLDQELYADFEELRGQREQMDQAISDWAHSLRDSDLEGQFSYTSIWSPRPHTRPMWLAVMHFFNHQTHHRGQVTTLLMQCGFDPGVTDLMFLPVDPEASEC